MSEHKKTLRVHTVVAGCALVATAGIAAFASAAGDDPPTTARAPVEASGTARSPLPDATERLRRLGQSQGIQLRAAATRKVPSPGTRVGAPDWVIVPSEAGGACVNTSRVVFCGRDAQSVEAGRASATEYPPDRYLGKDPETGLETVQPSDGTGVRTGLAPSDAAAVVVSDSDGRVLQRQTVSHGVYEVPVPPQGSGARVSFVDAEGTTLTTRPAEG